jgi:hypothetical protein
LVYTKNDEAVSKRDFSVSGEEIEENFTAV